MTYYDPGQVYQNLSSFYVFILKLKTYPIYRLKVTEYLTEWEGIFKRNLSQKVKQKTHM